MPYPLACPKCGAGLPPADEYGRAWCGVCCSVHETASAERLVEAAARIMMIDSEVLALLRQHFSATDSMDLAPHLPLRSEENARRVHAAHLPAGETILGLYDDTLFDSGEEGFLVTARRLCWKNEGEEPRMIEWADVDPDRLFADGKKLFLGNGVLLLADETIVDAAADVFHILALSARATSLRTPRGTQIMPSAPPRHMSKRPTFRPTPQPTLESPVAPYSYVQYAVKASSQPAPAFTCWHCEAAIEPEAPYCNRCTARPLPDGWKRTG